MADTNPTTTQVQGAVHWTDDNFQANLKQAVAQGKGVFVDFYADWCGPCQLAAPIVEELAKEYQDRVVVVKFNVDENPETTGTYGVMSIPTAIAFKAEGEEVVEADKKIGFPGEPGYRKMMDKVAGTGAK